MPFAREFDLDRSSSGNIGTLSLVGRYDGAFSSPRPSGGMPIPESFAWYEAWVLDPAVGGFGAGRLGMRFASFTGGAGPFGTGGGARGFSKLPSWVTVGNLGLAGGLIRGDMEVYPIGSIPGEGTVEVEGVATFDDNPRKSPARASGNFSNCWSSCGFSVVSL